MKAVRSWYARKAAAVGVEERMSWEVSPKAVDLRHSFGFRTMANSCRMILLDVYQLS